MLLEAKGVKLAFGERDLLDIDEFTLRDGQKIGLVGANGAGKSTLLRILAGEMKPDEGSVNRRAEIACIWQLEGGREDAADARLVREFGVKAYHDMLSGGEVTRRKIAAALQKRALILFADEPTTSLDLSGIRLLESQLKQYSGGLILISHDRALLDAVCDSVAYLENGKITVYSGNYSRFEEQLSMLRARRQFEYDAFRDEQARLKHAIVDTQQRREQVRHTPTSMGNSEARLHKREYTVAQSKISQQTNALRSRLSQLEEKERPRDLPDIRMKLGDCGGVTSKVALRGRRVNIEVPGRTLVKNADFMLSTGVRTALMGDNGCGKTTLLNMIKSGARGITVSPGVKIDWFDQDSQRALPNDSSIIAAVMRGSVQPTDVARTILARMNIRGDDVHKKIGNLSGGERAKVQLALLMVSTANMLILDEPTNHLDTFTLSAMDAILSDYSGTLLIVSHDRAAIRHIAKRLLIIENGELHTYEDGLARYEEATIANAAARERKENQDILRMRMATLISRITTEKNPDTRSELNAQYDSYARQLHGEK